MDTMTPAQALFGNGKLISSNGKFALGFFQTGSRTKTFVWLEGSQDWVMTYAQPKVQCDVFAVCGPFTICNDNELGFCKCMKGFSIKSPKDWELDDRTDGCMRNTPLDCASNKTASSLTDKFHSMPCVRLPQNGYSIEAATNADKCALVCLSNCSCTAYSYGNGGCLVWHAELFDVKQQQCDGITDTNGGTLYIRLASREEQSQKKNRRGLIIAIALGLSFAALFMLAIALVIWWNKSKRYNCTSNNVEGESGIVAFRYIDLQHATKNFSEKLGEGGFGSVFKGFLHDSRTIAVKKLAGAHQGEKQFRAEERLKSFFESIRALQVYCWGLQLVYTSQGTDIPKAPACSKLHYRHHKTPG
ncbi:hypothetical protein OsI_15877 [Oryza sativa Indica Group]|uniref:Apple domain-containing protein n=1 Tax=Oryza sativa subsp. indica TaxID=39946 RepID=A2XTE4_ORYSI|nr:hypothetical protein OsI_15877 [Oryza sativa Indica Group]